MRKHGQLYGLMMYPVSLTQEDHEETIHSADAAVRVDFKDNYQHHMASMQIIAESAKIYALQNWEKIKDWSEMEISIVDNTGEETFYYNYVDKKGFRFVDKDLRRDFEKMKKSWHNPVKTVSNVVLDTSDGDFSLDINGTRHMWIDNQSVIIFADFIEEVLNRKTLIVNGKELIYSGRNINVKQLKRLANKWGAGFSITYDKGLDGASGTMKDPDNKEVLLVSGSMLPGEVIPIVDGMIFNIIKTVQS